MFRCKSIDLGNRIFEAKFQAPRFTGFEDTGCQIWKKLCFFEKRFFLKNSHLYYSKNFKNVKTQFHLVFYAVFEKKIRKAFKIIFSVIFYTEINYFAFFASSSLFNIFFYNFVFFLVLFPLKWYIVYNGMETFVEQIKRK